ncbi:MAG: hypothetical protein SPG98_06480 [Porcincola intestinalis]|jgi:hypothetical protein|uniref:hypothetical protein n=1 Tax=Porcincola intestinalis TaxID=2606632 RepID=UPI002A91CC38|nr:hypothetical protein [Porcincola intestinalis]MCI7092991.1 hypothetical protein [Lachnospiraceae bacterium]MDY5332397.1 hypothetical protein [Porcincola intestinalis]
MEIEKKKTSKKGKGKTPRRLEPGEFLNCYYHSDCFAYGNGKCMILCCNDFDDGECPFYRKITDNQKEQEACMRRLVRIGRKDLLVRYRKGQAEAGAFTKDYSDGVAGEIKEYRESGVFENDRAEDEK